MERSRLVDVQPQQRLRVKDAAMVEEMNKLSIAVALVRGAVLSEKWAEAELSLLDAERQIAILHRLIADKHIAALKE